MPNLHSALGGMRSIQQDAQAALPVIPNNGNPAGAYNMPQPAVVGQPTPMQKPTLSDRYPWLKPTASMDNVRATLAARRPQPPILPRGNIP